MARGGLSGMQGRGGLAAMDGKIIAGTNVTISPTSGIGDVSISALAGGGGGGAPAYSYREVVGNATVLTTDATVAVNSDAAQRTAILPAANTTNAYQEFTIKRIGAAGGTNDVVVSVNGGGTIDGQANVTLGQAWGWITVQSDGTNYKVIG